MRRWSQPKHLFSGWTRRSSSAARAEPTAKATVPLVSQVVAQIASQNKNGLPVLAAIGESLEANKRRLFKFHDLDKRAVMQRGLRLVLEDILVDDAREKAQRLEFLRTHNKSDTPNYLLMQLFPPSNIRQSLFNYTPFSDTEANDVTPGVSYHKLFDEYERLPSPLHMNPEHFNLMVDKLLLAMNFKRPVVGLGGFVNSPQNIVRSYKAQLSERKFMLSKLNRLFHEMRRYSILMTSREKATLVAYTLYRDKPDIHFMVVNAYRGLKKPFKEDSRFDFDVYQNFKPDISTTSSFNVFLDLAIRHRRHDVIDVMTNEHKHLLNRQSYSMVLDYLSARHSKGDPVGLVAELLKNHYVLDTSLVNAIMKWLCRSGDIKAAEEVLNSVITTASASDGQVYRGLTSNNKESYNDAMRFYDELEKLASKLHLDLRPPCIIPNIDTFTPFIEFYSAEGQYSKVIEMLQMTKSAGLPVTTKVFRMVCTRMAQTPELWKIDQVVDITSVLLGEFQGSYTFDPDITKNSLSEIEIPNSLKPYVQHDISPETKKTLETGSFTKLPDDLVAQIVQAFQKVIAYSNIPEAAQLKEDISKSYWELQRDLKILRRSNPGKNLFTINEATYLKNAFLIDLMERVYTFI